MRLTVHLRRANSGAIDVSVDDAVTWHPSNLSPTMQLAGGSLDDLQTFLFDLMRLDGGGLEVNEANLRLPRQKEIGRQLHAELFGGPGKMPDPGRWLHIVPVLSPGGNAATRQANREFVDFVSRVPWTLLTRSDSEDAPFLALDAVEPVAITIDAAPERSGTAWSQSIKMPPYPRVLLVIPRVSEAGVTPTGGEAHELALVTELEPYFSDQARTCLKVVRSYPEFVRVIATDEDRFEPQVVYFYGHGLTEGFGTSFQFEGPEGTADWHNFDDVHGELHRLVQRTRFPPVIWVNACLGGAAESDSALRVLSPIACCVITTRTLSAVSDSQALGLAALPRIVRDGQAPPGAIRDALHHKPLPIRAARWASTIISVQYDSWTALGSEGRIAADLESAGDFPLRLDRAEPLGRVAQHLTDRLALAPASLPILWHGAAEQGLAAFETLIAERMRAAFMAWEIRDRHVDLQPDCAPEKPRDRQQHFLASLSRALSSAGASPARVDAARIKSQLANLGGGRTILLLSHGPFAEAHMALVHDYAVFWRSFFAMLAPAGMHVVLGFGLEEGVTGVAPQLDGSLIQPLGPVPPRELANHLSAYHLLYSLPPDLAAETAQELVEAHGGRFDRIRKALEYLAGI